MKSLPLAVLPAPLFLFLCLIIGGSVQVPLATFFIQLSAVALLVWPLMGGRQTQYRGEGMAPVWLALGVVILGLVQLIPLPPMIWSNLPGRDFLAEGYNQLGIPLPWLPINMDPSAALGAMMPLLVPVAIYLAILRREPPPASLLIGAILAATTLGALLGIVQVQDATQRYYPYEFSDWSSASGFFANPNHMGLLLLVAIPLAVGLGTNRWRAAANGAVRIALLVQLGAVALALLVVIPFNGSLAITILGGPVLIASALIPDWGKREHYRRAVSLFLVLAIVIATLGTFVARHQLTAMGQTGFATRADIWKTSWVEVRETFPVGTGFGTFPRIYPLAENPAKVDATYVNHAHNDYLELLLEGGVLAMVLAVLFFIWWFRRARSDWFGKNDPELGRAAAIASATILAHSFVDFPLRTPAIAALFGACLALMVVAIRPKPVSHPTDLHKTRHRTVR